jgi:hypothetical protein
MRAPLSSVTLFFRGPCTVVARWRKGFRELRAGSPPRLSAETGFPAVVATQLWHHQFLGGGLADMPAWSGSARPVADDVALSV